MIRIIGILLSAIFFFGLGDEIAYLIKKSSILKVYEGISPLSPFTEKMTAKRHSLGDLVQKAEK